MEFVGIDNYKYVLTDSWFWKSVFNTLVIFVLTTVPQHVISLFLAFVLNSGIIKLKVFFRNSYFLPYITSSVAVALIFGTLFGVQYGILNAFLRHLANFAPFQWLFNAVNLQLPIRWLGDPAWIKPSIALLVTWKFTGWNMIIYYAGLQKYPKQFMKQQEVDGANLRQIFFKITLPLLNPLYFCHHHVHNRKSTVIRRADGIGWKQWWRQTGWPDNSSIPVQYRV